MVKEIDIFIKLQVCGGVVNFVFLVGLVFGVKGVNIMEFCKCFNVEIQDKQGQVLLVVIMVFKDKFFFFVIKILLVVVQFFNVVKFKKGFFEFNCDKVGMVIWDDCKVIVENKMIDFNCFIVEFVMKMVVGIVCSMGIVVKGILFWMIEEEVVVVVVENQ